MMATRMLDLATHDEMQIQVEQPKFLTLTQDIAALRHALSQSPTSVLLRRRLGICLLINDEPDAAIALLAPLADETADGRVLAVLASAHLSRNTADADQAAIDCAERAAAIAHDPYDRADALATLGKAQLRIGLEQAAIASLEAALVAAPENKDAYKRLVAFYMSKDQPEAVLALADAFFGAAQGHSRLQVSRILALARLGRVAEARRAGGLECFLYQAVLPAPPGWDDIAAFNRDLVAELDRHPSIRFNRYGTASRETWRIDNPLTARSDVLMALQPMILEAVRHYVARTAGTDHPWIASRPASATLHSWCVMTTVAGYEEWHVHQFGWLSGVYYASVPDAVRNGADMGGCLAFGLPAEQVGAENAVAYGETLVRPEGGMLMLFPSHTFHRTFPHGGDERRVCIAFDIKPN